MSNAEIYFETSSISQRGVEVAPHIPTLSLEEPLAFTTLFVTVLPFDSVVKRIPSLVPVPCVVIVLFLIIVLFDLVMEIPILLSCVPFVIIIN